MTAAVVRIDQLLWFLRFRKSRSTAQKWIAEGHIRINGRRVTKPHHPVHPGDILTLPTRDNVLLARIDALPEHRLSAPAAALAWTALH